MLCTDFLYFSISFFVGYANPSRKRSRDSGSQLGLVVVQSLSRVQLFATPWTTAHQASLSSTNSRNLLKLMSIESVMPSNHLILCCPLLPPSILPSIRVFSNELAVLIKRPNYWKRRHQEDKMVGWHHRFNGHELGQTLGDGEGQGGLVCCSPWGCKG